jgi:hypothetical protein
MVRADARSGLMQPMTRPQCQPYFCNVWLASWAQRCICQTESGTGAAMSDILTMGSFCIQKPGTIPGVEMMGFESFYNARRHNFSRGRTTVADWDVHHRSVHWTTVADWEVESNGHVVQKGRTMPLPMRARSAPPFCRFTSHFGNMFTYRVTIASQAGGM